VTATSSLTFCQEHLDIQAPFSLLNFKSTSKFTARRGLTLPKFKVKLCKNRRLVMAFSLSLPKKELGISEVQLHRRIF
jgi:hypothetical protein